MIRLFAFTLTCLAISACSSERYFGGNGAEALVYDEHHSYEVRIKNKPAVRAQLANIIDNFESIDRAAIYHVEYRTSDARKLLQTLFASYQTHEVDPQRVVYLHNKNLLADLKMDVTVKKIKTEPCQGAQIQKELAIRDCFVETMRAKQVAYKARLVGE
ncbi:hypothetical protein L4C42_02365 [Vibrio wakamikoensis]|uniref:hypothetical protein n=1 Tax=Vibrio wakamikoensis TaxID=2910251 RepID=UPI003D20D13B